MKNQKQEDSSDVEEEDEWTAIQKFNALLHYEEQKQAQARQDERKRLMIIQLESQKKAKEDKQLSLKKEDEQYHK